MRISLRDSLFRASVLLVVVGLGAQGYVASGREPNTESVKRAVSRGVRWLVTRQECDGGWVDGRYRGFTDAATSLAVLALAKAGEAPDALARAADRMIRARTASTPQTSLVLMASRALSVRISESMAMESACLDRQVRYSACRLAEGQISAGTGTGGWSYTLGVGRPDMINTFWALHALDVARDSGHVVPRVVWRQALDYLAQLAVPWSPDERRRRPGAGVDPQEAAVGFTYVTRGVLNTRRSRVSGCCTAGGTFGVTVCADALREQAPLAAADRERAESLRRGGLRWMDQEFSVRSCPPDNDASHYWEYLYMFDLVESKSTVTVPRTHDLHGEVDPWVVRRQARNGSWDGSVVHTAFAILFLLGAERTAQEPVPQAAPRQTTPSDED